MRYAPDRGVVPRDVFFTSMDMCMNFKNWLVAILHFIRGVVPPNNGYPAMTALVYATTLSDSSLRDLRGLAPSGPDGPEAEGGC